MVYVLNKDGKPLMPTNRHGKIRHLLNQGLAKVIRKEPFTIKLLYNSTNFTQELTLGVDTGSKFIGTAVSNNDGNIVYISQVEERDNIKTIMKKRKTARSFRRCRKTRNRPCRFSNRKNSKRKGRLPVTIISKTHSHDKEINFIKSILPITTTVVEMGTFDPHLMKNPEMNRHWGYQRGLNFGFENTKAKVRYRDNYTCQCCSKSLKKYPNFKLEVHHIIFRENGGSDEEFNLITLCHDCHVGIHNGTVKLKYKGKKRGTLKYATQMNVICSQLRKKYPEAIETFGFITSQNRRDLNLPKTHFMDAVVISTGGIMPNFITNLVYYKKSVPCGYYKLSQTGRSNKQMNRGKINGFRRYDKIRYFDKEYFIAANSTTGPPILMDIFGKEADFHDQPRGFKTPRIRLFERISASTSTIIQPLSLKI